MNAIATRSLPLPVTLLLATAVGAASAEAPSWWPGGGDEAKAEKPAVEAADDSAMFDSSLFEVSWPKVEMPKLSWKPSFGGGDTPAAAGKSGGNPISRALDKVAEGSRSASDRVRSAWGSALSGFSGGGDDTTRTAKNDGGGFWSRFMSPAEPPKQSETVQEFLAQERVGTRR